HLQAVVGKPATEATIIASAQEHAPAEEVLAPVGSAVGPSESAATPMLVSPTTKFDMVGTQVQVTTPVDLNYQTGAPHAIAVAAPVSEVASRTLAVASQEAAPVSEAVSDVVLVAAAHNEAPTDITVAGGSVEENSPAGTLVATLGAVDPNANDTLSYAL